MKKRSPQVIRQRTFICSGAKIWNYPAQVKHLHFVTNTEVMGSVKRIGGQIGIIDGKSSRRIFLGRDFDG
jgi:hypothetical protein